MYFNKIKQVYKYKIIKLLVLQLKLCNFCLYDIENKCG